VPHGEEFSNSLQVKVGGTPLSADVAALLVNGYVDDSTNVPDLFVLRFNDEHGVVLAKAGFAIGEKVELSLQSTTPGGPEPLLLGEVTALEVEVTQAGMHTVVRGLDVSHRLFRGTRVEAYPDMTASDIVRKVAQRAKIEARVDATSLRLDHVTQDGVSDWEFLRRLAVENNRVLTVSAGRLEFVERPEATEAPTGRAGSRSDPLVLERGVNLVSLRGTVTSNGQVPEVEVRGWDPGNKQVVTARQPARTVSAALDAVTPQAVAGIFSSPPYVAGISTMSRQSQCTAAAASLADHLAGGFAELEGVARGNPSLRAGTAVQLTGVGAPFSGRYVLSGTRHDFSPDAGYLTTFVVSNTSERSLYGVATGALRGARPRIGGVVPALVTNVRDPEHLGRVKIQLPWLSESYESGWARPVLAGAGKHRGLAVLPEVGDEVLVAFGQDDMQAPFVLGGLYNGRDEPDKPWTDHVDNTSGEVKRRTWTSRTGMVVELDDTSGTERLEISTNSGAQRITLQQSSKGIELVSAGPVKVTAKQDVEVTTATGKVTVKGKSVAVEATADLVLKGSTVKVQGTGSTELSSSGVTVVRGSVVKIN